ncbi:uncharacterized protein [Amphiura filiformis]|uniref:uncharacterized protein n=1 Tax=Amphiura filiformis TaxID=82378 RepID=UPI003B216AF9
MADTSKATKYDLIQRKRVCDDIWLCASRPSEKCYKPCKIHNPAACDGAGLPGVDWEDDDVFEPEEIDDSPSDTSFSDGEVWDSDVDIIEEISNEAAVVNREMERWMQVADMFYNQPEGTQTAMPPGHGLLPPQPYHPMYFPYNAMYPTGSFPAAFPPLPGAFPFQPFPAYSATTHQDFVNANNMIMNNHLRSRTNDTSNQVSSTTGWDELIDEQERYHHHQQEMAAAMAAQFVGATEECETTTDNIPSRVPSVSYFSASTDFWRSNQQHQVDSQ